MASLSVLGVGVAIATDYMRTYKLVREVRAMGKRIKKIDIKTLNRNIEGLASLNELTNYKI